MLSLLSGVAFLIFSYLFKKTRPGEKVWPVDAFFLLFYLALVSNLAGRAEFTFFNSRSWLNIALVVIFIRSLSAFRIDYDKNYLNPAQLFILSFVSIIFIGTVLLMLPNATYHGISFLDAIFTSTSAVCVTGLVVADTGTFFTRFGQTIIALLIQAGGIGIMTFTSYFGYFFKGSASYQSRLMIQDMNNAGKAAEVFSTLKKIILVTFIIEAAGAAIIYTSIGSLASEITGGHFFFSIFHSISGFCNAGFSTLSNSLYEPAFRYNYLLHLTIAMLFIIGGLGFPIVFNSFSYIRHLIYDRLFRKKSMYYPWIIGINTRIVVITTLSLLAAGTLIFYIFEYNNTLAEHGSVGKIVTAFFGAATPRTAGFNTVDTSALNFSTIMIIFVLMWIGASPGSTGGGVKTSTFAIAILNFISIAKGKDRIEIFRREVSPISTRRAFAILTLSIIILGISILLLSFTDGEKGLLPLAFESFSAFSTVGLSLGITSHLSSLGKIVIVITMFIGRVSMLTILVAFLRKIVNLKYKYPTEDVLIN
ncbi:MAG: ATPase [Bacteroidales bacterium]|nr:ATPase [Bacteroidales bacterium]